jgi:WD40 repeat protein
MTPEEIEKAQVALERRQLELDRVVAERDRSFLNRNTGILISAAVSFAAVIVSIAQVWITTISKDKELQITTLQHKADIDSQERQKDRELAVSDAQRKRELDLNAARFITENRKAIFEGTPADRELFAKLIPTLFPPEVSAPLLLRIEKATPGPDSKIWQSAQRQSINGAVYSPDGRFFVTSSEGTVRMWDAQSSRVTREFRIDGIVTAMSFSPDGRQLLITTLNGSVERWDVVTAQLLQKTNAQP